VPSPRCYTHRRSSPVRSPLTSLRYQWLLALLAIMAVLLSGPWNEHHLQPRLFGQLTAVNAQTMPNITLSTLNVSNPLTGRSQHNPVFTDLTVGSSVGFLVTVILPEGTIPVVVINTTLPLSANGGRLTLTECQVYAIGSQLSFDNS